MTRIGLGLLLAALALACATPAPTGPNGRGFFFQILNNVKEVAPGHWAGSWANRGVCLDNVGQKDEEVGLSAGEGTFDGVWTSPTVTTSCAVKGKTTCTFKDGSSHTDEYTEVCKPGPDGLLIFEGRGAYVGGTGRFYGIQGTVSWTSRNLTPPVSGRDISLTTSEIGFSVVTGKYTLPKK